MKKQRFVQMIMAILLVETGCAHLLREGKIRSEGKNKFEKIFLQAQMLSKVTEGGMSYEAFQDNLSILEEEIFKYKGKVEEEKEKELVGCYEEIYNLYKDIGKLWGYMIHSAIDSSGRRWEEVVNILSRRNIHPVAPQVLPKVFNELLGEVREKVIEAETYYYNYKEDKN